MFHFHVAAGMDEGAADEPAPSMTGSFSFGAHVASPSAESLLVLTPSNDKTQAFKFGTPASVMAATSGRSTFNLSGCDGDDSTAAPASTSPFFPAVPQVEFVCCSMISLNGVANPLVFISFVTSG